MTHHLHFSLTVPAGLHGYRLDLALVQLLPDYSRSTIQSWIKAQAVTIEGQIVRTKDKVHTGQILHIQASLKPTPDWTPEAIPLDIVAEDEALLVISKPAGMVVHPAPGHPDQTLLNAILHHAPQCQALPRAGIIHRLDRDTSGLLVIAKTAPSYQNLSAQMRNRSITRLYQAIVTGTLISGATINQPLGRHPIQRKRMAVIPTGRPSITHYRILEKYRHHTRLAVRLDTGRTHQIRVHMAHIGHPLLGDPTYGGRLQLPKNPSPELTKTLRSFRRQALHAIRLELTHPLDKTPVHFEAPLPEDLQQLIRLLRAETPHE